MQRVLVFFCSLRNISIKKLIEYQHVLILHLHEISNKSIKKSNLFHLAMTELAPKILSNIYNTILKNNYIIKHIKFKRPFK